MNKGMFCALIVWFSLGLTNGEAQSGAWRLWAEGLPSGVYPRMAVAPNHDIFYSLLGTGIKQGFVYKANTMAINGQFAELPKVPRPVSVQNNIVALGYNAQSEPLVGVFRTDLSEPWMFRLDQTSKQWEASLSDKIPNLGGFCLATSNDGIIYAGVRWAYIYKSVDGGRSFQAIDENKTIKSNYPCYYPSQLNKSDADGAIFSINIDSRGRIYAGTETAGVIYSDDEGKTWHPADIFACKISDPFQQDTLSPMRALSISGNVGAIGFTKENNLVWSGVNMWELGWKNKLGFADMNNRTTSPTEGISDYLIQTGQQISKIVTSTKGQMFLHSGGVTGASNVGIYTSFDGIHWESFNQGISSQNDGLSQGSLVTDGDKVFMATNDGKVWIYENHESSTTHLGEIQSNFELNPNPVSNFLYLHLSNGDLKNPVRIFNPMGELLMEMNHQSENPIVIDVSDFTSGFYFVNVASVYKRFIKF